MLIHQPELIDLIAQNNVIFAEHLLKLVQDRFVWLIVTEEALIHAVKLVCCDIKWNA